MCTDVWTCGQRFIAIDELAREVHRGIIGSSTCAPRKDGQERGDRRDGETLTIGNCRALFACRTTWIYYTRNALVHVRVCVLSRPRVLFKGYAFDRFRTFVEAELICVAVVAKHIPSVRFPRCSPCTSKSRRKCLNLDHTPIVIYDMYTRAALPKRARSDPYRSAAAAKCLNSIT